MKTVNDLISELQSLKPSLRELPIVTIAPNGLEFDPVVKRYGESILKINDVPTKMIIDF